jgi:hypothetical protein
MRWTKHLAGVASVLVLLAGTTSAKAWFYPNLSYYYYGACPDCYWSRGLLCPWSLCCGGYGCYGGYGGYGYGGGYPYYGGCCLPNYSFCPNPPANVVTMETETEMGGYQAVSYVRVAGSRVAFIGGPR